MAVVYTVVFGRFAKFPSGGVHYPVFVFAGLAAVAVLLVRDLVERRRLPRRRTSTS